MRYWIGFDDAGILMVGREQKPWPDAADITAEVYDHVNDLGVARLDTGKTITFTQEDQSFPRLVQVLSA